MIRVLHILNSMNRGGIETTLMNIFRHIDRQEVVFDFLLDSGEEYAYNAEIRALGGRIYTVPPRRHGIIANIKALNRFFSAHPEYQIVHMHVSSLTYVEPLKAAKRYGLPVRIVHSRNTREGGSILHKYIHLWNRNSVKIYATDYFACSDLAAKWLFGKKQYEAGDYSIVHNGIQTEKFAYNASVRERKRDELGIGTKWAIVNVGRFHHQKNHMFLLDIFKAVHERDANSVLFLIGDGALRPLIEKRVKELGLDDDVVLLGVRSDIPDLLQAMDIFVMPSLYEGLPGSVVEAQGAGLPCILSDTVTQQVKITNLVQYISLSESASCWADKVFESLTSAQRRDTSRELISAGYDMATVSAKLQRFYIANEPKIERRLLSFDRSYQ